MDFTLDDEVPFSQLEEDLRRYLGKSGGWFTEGAVAIDVGRRVLSLEELCRLRRLFEGEFQLKIGALRGQSELLEKAIAQEAELLVDLVTQRRMPSLMDSLPRPQRSPLLLKGTCRSGTAIHHDGDVIILGDLNPGAQVTATGDIAVLGSLRGIAHAGATYAEPEETVITAFCLRPLQLRIAHYAYIGPTGGGKRSVPRHPEIAYVSGGRIVVSPLTGGFQRLQERNLV